MISTSSPASKGWGTGIWDRMAPMISTAAFADSSTEASLDFRSSQCSGATKGGASKAPAGKFILPSLAPPVRIMGTTAAPRSKASRASCATPGPPSMVMYMSPNCPNTFLRWSKSAPTSTSWPGNPLAWPMGTRWYNPGVKQLFAKTSCTPFMPPVTKMTSSPNWALNRLLSSAVRASDTGSWNAVPPRMQMRARFSKEALSISSTCGKFSCCTSPATFRAMMSSVSGASTSYCAGMAAAGASAATAGAACTVLPCSSTPRRACCSSV
mmetsp:Transcript_113698/g.361243  ORF Transcript_113698/g.361243 Transcript_113698/m.361243 type:complete len:268 (+) Transcript_113698:660-1463(+)